MGIWDGYLLDFCHTFLLFLIRVDLWCFVISSTALGHYSLKTVHVKKILGKNLWETWNLRYGMWTDECYWVNWWVLLLQAKHWDIRPRHRWERYKVDKKFVLESKSIQRTEDGLSPEINIKRGLWQGCVLITLSVNMYIKNIFGAMNTNKGIHIGGTTIHNLRYADDTVLLAETEEDLQEILNEANRIGKTFDMKMNGKKTKTMLVSKDVTSTKVSVKIDGDIIKQTDNYTYLGQTITSNGKCDDEILKRIEIARGAFNSMLKTITARHISMKTRKRIIKAYVLATLLYGCETWTITTRNMKKLQSFEMWAYRKMMKISWRDKKTNEEVLQLADERLYIVPTIMKKKPPTLVTWSDVTISTGCFWRVQWRGNWAEEGQERSGRQTSQNGRECDTRTSWELLKIGSQGGSWQPTFSKKVMMMMMKHLS